MARILVIDDDELVRKSFLRLFSGMGHEVLLADSLGAGEAEARKGVDVICLDLDLPDGDGLKAIDALAAAEGHPEVIVITGLGSFYGAQETLQGKAWDYIRKPASPQVIKDTLQSALHYRRDAREQRTVTPHFDRSGIQGEDASIQCALREMEKAAKSDASVLISGETGVGKELAAKAIHKNSRRKAGPFIVVDCSNMTDTLIESLLYGHVKGAFTGAHADRKGLVAEADGGVLFLDEVGEMSLSLQKSFLRVIQERRYRAVGSGREHSSDFRLIAATNRDLNEMTREGTFRADLLFRIRTVEIVLPPLRERGEDRERLARHFIDLFCDRYGLEPKQLSDELSRVVLGYRWPGNVRELASAMEAAVINAGGDPVIVPKHLPGNVRLCFLREREEQFKEMARTSSAPPSESSEPQTAEDFVPYDVHKAMRDFEYFSKLLEATRHDISLASRVSGLSVPSIYRHLALAGIPTRHKRAKTVQH